MKHFSYTKLLSTKTAFTWLQGAPVGNGSMSSICRNSHKKKNICNTIFRINSRNWSNSSQKCLGWKQRLETSTTKSHYDIFSMVIFETPRKVCKNKTVKIFPKNFNCPKIRRFGLIIQGPILHTRELVIEHTKRTAYHLCFAVFFITDKQWHFRTVIKYNVVSTTKNAMRERKRFLPRRGKLNFKKCKFFYSLNCWFKVK